VGNSINKISVCNKKKGSENNCFLTLKHFR